jgi:hypothetical protein
MITEAATTTNTKITTSVTTAMTGTVANGRKSAATETTDEPRSASAIRSASLIQAAVRLNESHIRDNDDLRGAGGY